MKRSGWVLLAVLVVGGLITWIVLRSGSGNVAYDFIAQFANAEEKRPVPTAFTVTDATIAGETKHAIAATGPTRIAWDVTVPDNAWLTVSAGMLEQGWTVPGDGVVFRVSVNDDEILNLTINPYKNPSDRHWQDFTLDLSEYAGEKVRIFLKTNPGTSRHEDRNGDFPVWGEPRLITK